MPAGSQPIVMERRVSELLRSNDPVLLGYVEVLLRQVGISCLIADQHMSIVEGSIGAFPRRLLVCDDNLLAARRLLEEADLGAWVYHDPAAPDASAL